MDFGTLSPMLKRLESKGLLTRKRQPTDERRVLVDLTPKGVSSSEADRTDVGRVLLFSECALERAFRSQGPPSPFRQIGRTERR
jgi:MarR family transcriptional regulator, organic hydroperoxide resistance regulator